MTRDAQRIATLEATVERMLDIGARSEIDRPGVREHLARARQALSDAFHAANS